MDTNVHRMVEFQRQTQKFNITYGHTFAVNALRAGDDVNDSGELGPCHCRFCAGPLRPFHGGHAADQRGLHGAFYQGRVGVVKGKYKGKRGAGDA